jgi:hypothetical protein
MPEDKLKKKPTPSKSEGKKGQPGGNGPTGAVPPSKLPVGTKKPTPWEPAPGLVPLRGKVLKHNN